MFSLTRQSLFSFLIILVLGCSEDISLPIDDDHVNSPSTDQIEHEITNSDWDTLSINQFGEEDRIFLTSFKGKLVVSDGNLSHVSENGEIWRSAVTGASHGEFFDVSNSQLLIIDQYGVYPYRRLWSSDDGINWGLDDLIIPTIATTSSYLFRNSKTITLLTSREYRNSEWVSEDAVYTYSRDSHGWNQEHSSNPPQNVIYLISDRKFSLFNDFLIVPRQGTTYITNDGINWNEQDNDLPDNMFVTFEYQGSLFGAIRNDLYKSNDGVNWNLILSDWPTRKTHHLTQSRGIAIVDNTIYYLIQDIDCSGQGVCPKSGLFLLTASTDILD